MAIHPRRATGTRGGNAIMIRHAAIVYAFRSQFRHTRRTLLSILGCSIGCAITLIAVSWLAGEADMIIGAVAESGAGHLTVVPVGWLATREQSMRIATPDAAITAVSQHPSVLVTAPRARVNALLAFGNRMVGVEMSGVDPEAEQAGNRIVYCSKIEGRYLLPGDRGSVVIGLALARRLKVGVDDDLYVTLAGRDGITGLMLRIVGVLDTGSKELNQAFCHVLLGDVAEAVGIEGPSEISILLKDPRHIEAAKTALSESIPSGNALITWRQTNADMAANLEGDTAFSYILIAVILIVVSLGIASAQLTAVLERRRELAVLSALGMKAHQVAVILMAEAAFIGVAGAIGALLVGGGVAHWFSTGVDISHFFGGETSMGGVLFDPVIHGYFGPKLIAYALGISLVSTILATLYPIWFASRLNPAEALRSVG
jgi:ABC-type lipoprotein release transport system permease subunit